MKIPIEQLKQSVLKVKALFFEKLSLEEKSADHFGLDIGTFSVKMAQISIKKDKISLINCGMAKIKNGNVSEAIKEVMGTFDTDIKKAVNPAPPVETRGFTRCGVNIGLSGQGVILRYVVLPKMPLKELKQSISTEADKYVPFPIEDVILDCYVLKELTQENKILVLIATAKKDLIQERINLLSNLNLAPKVIDINSVAVVNCFNELRRKVSPLDLDKVDNKSQQAVAILNIGASLSCVDILEDDIPKLSRDIYIGGNDFSKRIGYVLNLDFESAEDLKCNPSEEQGVKNLEVCELLLNNLVNELRISFDYYETENNISIGKLYLSGGSAYLKGIGAWLNKSLGIEAEVWDPLPYLEIRPDINIDNLKSQFSKLSVAIGLALR